MIEEEIQFIDDKVFVYTPLPLYGEEVCKAQLVMTKEIFQECYKRWIEPQESIEPQQEDIAKDGTLTVRVADGRKVTRVLVCGDNLFGGLYYPDEDAEPQTGHWILSIEDWNKWTCSKCGHTEKTDIHVSLGYDFCPKCGIKLVEPQEGANNG